MITSILRGISGRSMGPTTVIFQRFRLFSNNTSPSIIIILTSARGTMYSRYNIYFRIIIYISNAGQRRGVRRDDLREVASKSTRARGPWAGVGRWSRRLRDGLINGGDLRSVCSTTAGRHVLRTNNIPVGRIVSYR